MLNNEGRKTDQTHWDDIWSNKPSMRLPTGIFVGTANICRLLKSYVSPGMRVLEIGCAPGKMLAWVAKVLQARVSGVDYSGYGINTAKELFDKLGISGDLRCEDIFETSFKEGSFDCVISCGVIEHFNNPKQLVDIHVRLVKPGGKAVIIIPNYGGVYGRLQQYFDPENLTLHNLDIMTPSSLKGLASLSIAENVRSYPFGRFSLMLILDKKLPKWLAKSLTLFLNVIGHLQPLDISALCPLLVLEITRENTEN